MVEEYVAVSLSNNRNPRKGDEVRQKVEAATFVDLDPGMYVAMFQGREGPHPGKFGKFVVWSFAIDVEGEPEVYTGLTSMNFIASRRCKAWRWARAIDPTLSEETEEWDDVEHVGKVVQVLLDVKGDDDSGFLSVKEVLPCLVKPQGRKSVESLSGQEPQADESAAT